MSMLGAKLWNGMSAEKCQSSEVGSSLNGPDLFTEWSFRLTSLPKPSFTERLALIQ